MNGHRPIWIVLASLQAIAIVLLGWSLLRGTNVAAEPRVDAASEAAAAVVPAAPAAVPEPVETEVVQRLANDPDVVPTLAPLRTLVHGSVRVEGDGALPAYTSVSLLRGESTKPLFSSNLRSEVSTFAWPDLDAGDYELRVRAQSMRDHAQTFTIPEGAPELRLDVVLEPSWLVKVLLLAPDGTPWHESLAAMRNDKSSLARMGLDEAVQVIALWHEFPRELPTSDLRSTPLTVAMWRSSRGFEARSGRGRELPARYAGQLEMPERRAAHVAAVFKEVVLATAPLPVGQEELTLTIDPAIVLGRMATLRVQIVDRDGKPLAAAKVGVNDAQSWRQPTAVDADGRLEQTELLPGEFRLSVSCEGYAAPSCSIVLAPGAVTDLGALVLLPQRSLRIEVQDAPEGDALRGSLLPLGAMPHASLQPDAMSLGVRAGVATVSVADGRYRLVLSGAGGARVEFDTRTLGDQPLVVKLQPEGAIDFDPSGLDGPTRVVLRAADGVAVLDRWVTWRTRWQQPVLPGAYTLSVQPLVGAAREQQLVVGSDAVSCTL